MQTATKSLRSRHKEATREAILDAAQAELGERGPSGRVEDVAHRAGVSLKTVYNHFSDRDTLLAALFERHREMLLSRLDSALEENRGEPFDAQLSAFLGAVLAHFVEHRALVAVAIQEDAAGGRAPRRKGFLMREVMARAEALVRNGVKAGALRADDAGVFASFLVGVLRTVAARAVETDAPVDAPKMTQSIMKFFLQGAGAKRS